MKDKNLLKKKTATTTNSAANKQGAALLKSQAAGTYKPPTPKPAPKPKAPAPVAPPKYTPIVRPNVTPALTRNGATPAPAPKKNTSRTHATTPVQKPSTPTRRNTVANRAGTSTAATLRNLTAAKTAVSTFGKGMASVMGVRDKVDKPTGPRLQKTSRQDVAKVAGKTDKATIKKNAIQFGKDSVSYDAIQNFRQGNGTKWDAADIAVTALTTIPTGGAGGVIKTAGKTAVKQALKEGAEATVKTAVKDRLKGAVTAAPRAIPRAVEEQAAKVVRAKTMPQKEFDAAVADGRVMEVGKTGKYIVKDGKNYANVKLTGDTAAQKNVAQVKKAEAAELKKVKEAELAEAASAQKMKAGTFKGTMDDLKANTKSIYKEKTPKVVKTAEQTAKEAAAVQLAAKVAIQKAEKEAGRALTKAERSVINKASFAEAKAPAAAPRTATGNYQVTLNDGTTHLVSAADYPEIESFQQSFATAAKAAAPTGGSTARISGGSVGGGKTAGKAPAGGYKLANHYVKDTIAKGKGSTALRNRLRKAVSEGKMTQAEMDKAMAGFAVQKGGGVVNGASITTKKGGAALPDLFAHIVDNNLTRAQAENLVTALAPELKLTDGHLGQIAKELDTGFGKQAKVASTAADGTTIPKGIQREIDKSASFYVNKKGVLTTVDKAGAKTTTQLTPDQAALVKEMKSTKSATKEAERVSTGKTSYEADRVAAREEAFAKYEAEKGKVSTEGKKLFNKEFNKMYDTKMGGDPVKARADAQVAASQAGKEMPPPLKTGKPPKGGNGKTTEVINGKKVTGSKKQVDKVNNIVNPKEVPQASKEIMHRGKNPQAEWDTTAIAEAGAATKVENATVGGVKQAGWRIRNADGSTTIYPKKELGPEANMALADKAGIKVDRAAMERISAKSEAKAYLDGADISKVTEEVPVAKPPKAEKPTAPAGAKLTKEQKEAMQPEAQAYAAAAKKVKETDLGRKLTGEEKTAVNKKAYKEFWASKSAGDVPAPSKAATVANTAGKTVDDVAQQVIQQKAAATTHTPAPAAAVDPAASVPPVTPEVQAAGDAMAQAAPTTAPADIPTTSAFETAQATSKHPMLKKAGLIGGGLAAVAGGMTALGGYMNNTDDAVAGNTGEPSITELLNGKDAGGGGYNGGGGAPPAPQQAAPQQAAPPAPQQAAPVAQEAYPEWLGDGTIPEDTLPADVPVEEMPFEDILTDELQEAIEGAGGYTVENIMASYQPYIEDEQAAIDANVDADITAMKEALSARGILNSDLEVTLEQAIRSKANSDKEAVYSKYFAKAQDTSIEYQYKYAQLDLQQGQLDETTRMNDFEMAKYDQEFNQQIKELELEYQFKYDSLTFEEQKFLWDKYVDTQKLSIDRSKASSSGSAGGANGKTLAGIAEDLQARIENGSTNQDIANRLREYISYGYITGAQATTIANNLDYKKQ